MLMLSSQLRLTPKESDRLRQVSYERQLARGFKRPGYAGLVAERFGDAEPFVPRVLKDGEDPEASERKLVDEEAT
jgi:hypothetical protein